jgi:hypothetical protein
VGVTCLIAFRKYSMALIPLEIPGVRGRESRGLAPIPGVGVSTETIPGVRFPGGVPGSHPGTPRASLKVPRVSRGEIPGVHAGQRLFSEENENPNHGTQPQAQQQQEMHDMQQ